MRRLFGALRFLTRLPTPRLRTFQPDDVARAAPWYPVVGWIVGAIGAAALWGSSHLWPGLPAAIIAMGAGVLMTGALHEDGLADTADGLGGGSTPERRLEIMKDSRIGVYGVLALLIVLGLKVAVLGALPPGRAALALVLAHGAARAYPAVIMATLPYARAPEAAKLGVASLAVRPWEAIVAAILGALPLLLMGPVRAGLALTLASVAVLTLAVAARRLVGGFTGDILGAAEQLAELGLLLGLGAVLTA